MGNTNKLMDAGLSKKVSTALIEQGIDSVEKLCSFSLDDIEVLEGIDPAALMKIAKIKEANQFIGIDMASGPDMHVEVPIEKYMTKEPPKDKATVTTKTYAVELQFRHAEWITRAAEAYGMTEEQVIEQAIRQAYAKDPYKAGDTASSGSILKHDNPYANK